MDLNQLRKTWEALAKTDPMFAVLSDPAKRGRSWDPAEFFQSGVREIEQVLETAKQRGYPVTFDTALDFGCGVGRLTQALSRHFAKCYGVDISEAMIREAQRYNQFADCCIYVQNDKPDLQFLGDSTVDFLYTYIVLQHMEPAHSMGYIREFIRVLRPKGLLVFQLPNAARERTLSVSGAASAPLPTKGFQAKLRCTTDKLSLHVGDIVSVQLEVTNPTRTLWPALGQPDGRYRLFIGNHWHKGTELILYDDRRCELPHDLGPGDSVVIPFVFLASLPSGEYLLEFDMGQEGVTWFKDWGSQTVTVPVQILEPDSLASSAGGPQSATDVAGVQPAIVEAEQIMDMYGVATAELISVVNKSGGVTLAVEEDPFSRAEAHSYRYWVTRA